MKRIALLLMVAGGFLAQCARAQWQDETYVLKPGWNAVFLHIDASYDTMDHLIADPTNRIGEVWLWNPALSPDRYISDPQSPVLGSDWLHWDRNPAISDTFNRLIPNAAYLVRNTNTTDFTWTLRGQPAPPRYNWQSKGVNFIGFSVPAVGPIFANFLLPQQDLLNGAEFYRYSDTLPYDLSPSKFNGLFNLLRVQRGEAFWVKWPDHFNNYFGAFDVSLQNSQGIRFNEALSVYTLRIANRLSSQSTVTMTLRSSLTPPSGQKAIAGMPPLLKRGTLDTTTLTYGQTPFGAPQTLTLAPVGQAGSTAEVVLGLDRSAMTAAAGSLYAAVLRLTDSQGFSQVDLPVSATVASKAGLWIGSATVTHVQQYLKNFELGADGKPLLGTNGISYSVTNVDTSFGPAASPFSLRLIVHNGTNGVTRLFQRIYTGIDRSSNIVLATKETILDPKLLAQARRISATHLPWTDDNSGWAFTGSFAQGSTLNATVTLLNNDQPSNPFLHEYHPDHDNLNATFDQILPCGAESYDVVRNIALQFLPPSVDFNGLTDAGSELGGNYAESLTFKGSGNEQRVIYTKGTFKLTRISMIEAVTTTP